MRIRAIAQVPHIASESKKKKSLALKAGNKAFNMPLDEIEPGSFYDMSYKEVTGVISLNIFYTVHWITRSQGNQFTFTKWLRGKSDVNYIHSLKGISGWTYN
jgi:hypothetical protein